MSEFLINRRRDKVLAYLLKVDTTPLAFCKRDHKPVQFPSLRRLRKKDSLIMEILSATEYLSSLNMIGFIETYPGRRRSAVDIWRHAVAIQPDISIFDVMESIYRCRKYMAGGYCIQTRRTVFRLLSNMGQTVWSLEFDRNFMCRDFGMYFSTWRTINRKESS